MMADRASFAMSGFVSPLRASTTPTPDVESVVSGSMLVHRDPTEIPTAGSVLTSSTPATQTRNAVTKPCKNRRENGWPSNMEVMSAGNVVEMSPQKRTRRRCPSSRQRHADDNGNKNNNRFTHIHNADYDNDDAPAIFSPIIIIR